MNKQGPKAALSQRLKLVLCSESSESAQCKPVAFTAKPLLVKNLAVAPEYEVQTEQEFAANPLLFTTSLLERLGGGEFRVRDFFQHYSRLEHYVKQFKLRPLPSAEQINAVLRSEVLGKLSAQFIRLRISVSRTEVSLTAGEFVKISEPFKLISKRLNRFLPEFKTAVIASSLEAQKEAEQRGAHTCLLVSSKAQVLEGLWSSLFWIDDRGEIFTSPLKGILPGILRERLLLEHRVREEEFSLVELCRFAKQVYLTSSLQGIVRVSQIDEQSFDLSSDVPTSWGSSNYTVLKN